MARTTPKSVEKLLLDQYEAGADLQPFIDTATVLVDEVVTCATARGRTLSSTLLERIEANLAAHFYGHGDQFFANQSTEGASATYQGQTGMYLESSKYGQAAMTLDISGCLRSMSKGEVAEITWLGKAPSAQVDYIDRD